jgi:hypothetical protein
MVGNELDLTNVYTGNYTLQSVDVNDCDTLTGPYFIPEVGGPLMINILASPQEICIGGSSQLNALSSGGSGEYTYTWTSDPPGWTSDIQDPVVNPTVTTTYYCSVSDGYSLTSGESTIHVNELPLADAGDNKVVPYGVSTTLNGSCNNGSGNYSWSWEPSDMLVNPWVQNPATYNLYEPTVFSLTVTDLESGCVSETDVVSVTLSGGPLSITALAKEPGICKGDSSVLVALAGGGNFPVYAFTWKHNGTPIGFDSVLTLWPEQDEIYTVTVDDGYNIATTEVSVDVFNSPQFHLNDGGEQIIACPFDTITLFPSNTEPGWSYLWSNGSTRQSIEVGTTGIGFYIKEYHLQVTGEEGCVGEEEVKVIFDFSACLGTEEHLRDHGIRIFPNPSSGKLTIEFENVEGYSYLTLMDNMGREVKSRKLENIRGHFSLILNTSDLARGVYLINIFRNNEVIHSKIVVE